jgi:acyl-coenzyme A synthetase/AMP-(fatty) acid ligase
MSSDRHNIVANDEVASDSVGAYPVLRHAHDDDVVAIRANRPIYRADFLSDVAALAAQLPAHRYVLNLCTDRYRFAVGLAAALCRQQISLLPPNDAPGVLRAVASDYPDLYALTDTARPPFPAIVYPENLDSGCGITEVPLLLNEQPALILFTSGSTGRPKPVAKSWGALVRSAVAAGERLGAPALRGGTLIGTVPHQHSYGLESTILLGLQHGLAINAERPFYPADICAAIEAAPRPRILVTTPVHIRALLTERETMPQLDLIVSATAPLPVELAAHAEASFRAPLVEIYGCTEAGQVATRRTVNQPQWQCLDGVFLQQDHHGSWVSGPSVQSKTLLHDVIERTGADSFVLGGRSADMINVAGKRTSLAHLNHQLVAIDGVKDGVFVIPDEDGQRVARLAAIVVAPELPAGRLMQALRERIDAAFLPRPLVFVDALPRNSLGKLPRETLIELIGRNRHSK